MNSVASPASPVRIRIAVGGDEGGPARADVSALVQSVAGARAGCVLAHGAGAGMEHPFMAALADGLAARRVATLRYQFPYMDRGSRRPDRPEVAHAAVRAAVAEAGRRWPGLPLVAGGKSFGARMTSQAQAAARVPGVLGLVAIGFPLHPAGKPGVARAEHLDALDVPILFLQGTRDELAELALLQSVVDRHRQLATLHLLDDADHGFHVRARSGRSDGQVLHEMLDVLAPWIVALAAPAAPSDGSAPT